MSKNRELVIGVVNNFVEIRKFEEITRIFDFF